MSFPYKIHFVGLVCMVKQSASAYLAALPDGQNYHDPCSGTLLEEHLPYMIIPIGQLVSSDINGSVINRCFVIELRGATTVEFPMVSGAPNDDDTVKNKNGYLWSEIDPNFKLDPSSPANTILTVPLTEGTFLARRLEGDDTKRDLAVFTEVHVDRANPGQFTIYAGGGEVVVTAGAEIVIANVAPGWITDVTYGDDPTHFNLYYRMHIGTVTACKQPGVKKPPFTTSLHPYLTEDRGLQIACSSTNWP